MINLGDVTAVLTSVEDGKPNNRLNDAKCDSSGRLWFGTAARRVEDELRSGAGFYSYSGGT